MERLKEELGERASKCEDKNNVNAAANNATPAASRASPAASRASPAASNASPAASRASPAASRASPAASRASPAASRADSAASRADFSVFFTKRELVDRSPAGALRRYYDLFVFAFAASFVPFSPIGKRTKKN